IASTFAHKHAVMDTVAETNPAAAPGARMTANDALERALASVLAAVVPSPPPPSEVTLVPAADSADTRGQAPHSSKDVVVAAATSADAAAAGAVPTAIATIGTVPAALVPVHASAAIIPAERVAGTPAATDT